MENNLKIISSELGMWLILGSGQGKLMMSLEHFVVPESKGRGRNRTCQKSTGVDFKSSQCPKLE